ncbi:unnamed protein product [Phytomonas sp. Hart1]|nr:unnamed protein product [Phytomonas sp. Hart1]|eukprot:CCW71739.1 unnamed protein product [Phytomonas sp. isolate Hart1]
MRIVGPYDSTIFECSSTNGTNKEDLMCQFMLYSSLDVLDDIIWQRDDIYVSKVDQPYGEKYYVSAFVGLAPIRLIMMQDTEPKDSLRVFFAEAYELTMKYLLNPFFDATKKIESASFHNSIMTLLNRSSF